MALVLLFWASALVALSGAVMPGPVLTVTVARTVVRGFGVAPRVVLGHALLEIGVVAGLFLGLPGLLQNTVVRGVIGLAGGSVLLWMGLGLVTAARGASLVLEEATGDIAGGPARDVALGFLASIANPYWLLWWATVGLKLSAEALAHGLPGLAAFTLGHLTGDLAWYATVGALVAFGRRTISDRYFRGFLLVCGSFLLGLAVYFLGSGWQWLRGV